MTAVVMAAAVAYGLWLLVDRGRLSWPPHELLSGAFTLAGCLGLVGPLVITWRGSAGGAGELMWMTGGLLIWIHNGVAAARGELSAATWATPLEPQTMGLTALAVGLAGWRSQGAGGWSWTNVTGWLIGLVWVGLAVWSLWNGSLSPTPGLLRLGR